MLNVPGEKNAGHRRQPRQQHQRHADSIRREMIVDAERRNPGCARHRDRFARCELDEARQRDKQPRDRREQGDRARRGRVSLRQEHERQHAEE